MLLGVIIAVSLAAAVGICLLTGSFSGYAWIWMLPLLLIGLVLLGIVLAFLFLWLMAAVVDLNKEQKKDSKFYRKTIELYLESAFPLIGWHVKTKGMEKMPKDGRFMLVCNHVSLADPIMLLRVFRGRQLAFIAKRESQSMFLVGKIMHKLLCQLINRENDKEALKTIIRCIQLLREDTASIGVFPEGYINDDRKLHHFRPGVFKIAKKANVPIVVCTMKNTKDSIPNILRRRTNVELSVLAVIMPEEHADLSTTEIARQTYEMMAADLGPDLVAQEQE